MRLQIMGRLTLMQWLSFALSGAAFVLFVVNQYLGLSGKPFDFNSQTGAMVLTAFLAVGLGVQIGKIVQGHHSRMEFVLTLIQVGVHVYAELAIWTRTQILGMDLPPDIGKWLVSSYWLLGFIDLMIRYLPRELALLRSTNETPLQREARLEAELIRAQAQLELRENQLEDTKFELSKTQKSVSRASRRKRKREQIAPGPVSEE